VGPIDTDDLEHAQKLRIERTLFRHMLVRLSITSLVVGAALYCLGTILDQLSVVGTAAGHTIIPLGCCVGIISPNDGIWESGKRLQLQIHKLCVTLMCCLLGFDLGALCAVIGT
jgi:hypothetical protein